MNDTHTIIGMQGAGKTTYLAALWHLVNSNEIQTALVLDRLEGDANYLNEMVESWQKCEKVRRTSAAEDHPIVIYLKQRTTGVSVALNFTDLSGEKFEHQFAGRYCSPEYVAEVNGSGGVLLFVNADRAHKGVTIKDAQGLLDGEDNGNEIEWQPSFVSEQAQLVDLLQCLQKAPFAQKKRRLAVIVSAWDVVPNRNSANDWLLHEMPFLAQFLSTNQHSFETKMWGVSAQGGVLMADAQGKILDTKVRTELLRQTPSNRIRCVSSESASSDITLPLCWLSGIADG
jgi:hypothetical protein